MTPEREPVDDAALIAEAERLASKEIEVEEMGTLKWDRTMISHLIRLARLIAAAADLLDACIAVSQSSMRNEAYDKCIAAIARATDKGEMK